MRRRVADLSTAEYDRYWSGWGLIVLGVVGGVGLFVRPPEDPLEAAILLACAGVLFGMGLHSLLGRKR